MRQPYLMQSQQQHLIWFVRVSHAIRWNTDTLARLLSHSLSQSLVLSFLRRVYFAWNQLLCNTHNRLSKWTTCGSAFKRYWKSAINPHHWYIPDMFLFVFNIKEGSRKFKTKSLTFPFSKSSRINFDEKYLNLQVFFAELSTFFIASQIWYRESQNPFSSLDFRKETIEDFVQNFRVLSWILKMDKKYSKGTNDVTAPQNLSEIHDQHVLIGASSHRKIHFRSTLMCHTFIVYKSEWEYVRKTERTKNSEHVSYSWIICVNARISHTHTAHTATQWTIVFCLAVFRMSIRE